MTAFLLALAVALAPQAPRETDPAALFARGQTWTDYLEGVQAQRAAWLANAARAKAPDELVARLKAAADGLRFLAIVEASCSDSVQTVPYLARLAGDAGVELRIVSKATGLAVAEAHPTPDGRAATPTVVLLRDGRTAGAWIERPAVLQAWYLAERPRFTSREFLDRKTGWYEWDRGDSTMREIVALAERRPPVSDR